MGGQESSAPHFGDTEGPPETRLGANPWERRMILASLPLPGSDLALRPLPIRTTMGPWIRAHGLHRHPVHFGHSGLNRFDDPDKAFGVLYTAEDLVAAYAETVQLVSGAHGRRGPSETWLRGRGWSRLVSVRPLRLVNLVGPDLARLGIDNRISAGPRETAQAWAKALHAHPDAPDGVRYMSRHLGDSVCVALFDRCSSDLLVLETAGFTDDIVVLVRLLQAHGHVLIPAE